MVENHATSAPDVTQSARAAVTSAASSVSEAVRQVKPKFRGWIHAATTPLVLAMGIVLIVISPPVAGKVAAAVFSLTALSLFGMSAVYHRFYWSAKVAAVLRRLDHANIFLIIAGTYTPLAVLILPTSTAIQILAIVWGGAALGVLAHMFWMSAPRWVYTPVYIALGWVAVAYMSQFYRFGGAATVALILAGGIFYTAGAVIYALKRPNPSPKWFGFHEIFHACTVAAFACHTVAIFMAAVAAR